MYKDQLSSLNLISSDCEEHDFLDLPLY